MSESTQPDKSVSDCQTSEEEVDKQQLTALVSEPANTDVRKAAEPLDGNAEVVEDAGSLSAAERVPFFLLEGKTEGLMDKQQLTALVSEPANPDVRKAAEPLDRNAEVVEDAGSLSEAEPLEGKTEGLKDVTSPKPTEPREQEAVELEKSPLHWKKTIAQVDSVHAAECLEEQWCSMSNFASCAIKPQLQSTLEEQTNVAEVANIQKVLEQKADKSLEQKIEVPEVADVPKVSELKERGTEIPEDADSQKQVEPLEPKIVVLKEIAEPCTQSKEVSKPLARETDVPEDAESPETLLLQETESCPQRAVVLEDLPIDNKPKVSKGPARISRVSSEKRLVEPEVSGKTTEASELENEPKDNEETMRVSSEEHEEAESQEFESKLLKKEIQLLNDIHLKHRSGDFQKYESTDSMTVNGCEWEIKTVAYPNGLMRLLKRRSDKQELTDPTLSETFVQNVSSKLAKNYIESKQGSNLNKAYNKAIGWCSTANNWIDGESIQHMSETILYYALLALAFLLVVIKD